MSNTEHSPAPGTPQTGYKAYAATALTAITAFVLYWIADEDPFTAKEAAEGAVGALVSAGIVGGGTFLTKNKAKTA